MNKVITPIIVPDELRDLISKVIDFVGENCDKNHEFEDLLKKKYIGGGAYGEIYGKDDINYIIKVQKLKNEFFQEVIALDELKDTGFVVKMFAAWTCDGLGYIIMEKLNRIDDFYKDGDGHDPAVIGDKLWEDVGKNLNVLSDRGWLHLDVHRGNIMVTNKGEFILIDFGLAVKKTKSGDQTYPHHKYSRDFPNITWDQLKAYQNFQFQINYNGCTLKEKIFGYSRGNCTEDKQKFYDEAIKIWDKEEQKIIQEARKKREEIIRHREEESIRRQIEESKKREQEEEKEEEPPRKKSK